MATIQHIRAWPQEKKMKLIWFIAGASAVTLIVFWIFSNRAQPPIQNGNTILDTFKNAQTITNNPTH